MKSEYKSGDDVWIAGIENGKLTKGKVLERLDLSKHGYTFDNYLIEIDTHVDPLLEVRCIFTMSEDEKGPLGIFRKVAEEVKNAS